ncbi:MAG: hypothetical protein WDW36_000562 [Sanguina aurantia]
MPVSEAAIEAVGGAVGSVISVAVTYPLTIVSTWQGLEHKAENNDIMALKQVFKLLPSPIKELCVYGNHKGWPSLVAGLPPVLGATAVSQALYFYLYSNIRQTFVAHRANAVTYNTSSSSRGGSTRNTEIGIVGSMLVASLAGCGSVLVTNPAWVIATQLQAASKGSDPTKKGQGFLDVARQLYAENGIRGFWKGIWPALLMVLNPTLQYILYEQLIAQLLKWKKAQAELAAGSRRAGRVSTRLNSVDVFLLSALAKLGATLVTYPMLLVKNRLQAMNNHTEEEARYTGVFDAIRRIYRLESFPGFYKGFQVKVMQTVLAAALLMSIKEQVYGTTKLLLTLPGAKQALKAAV